MDDWRRAFFDMDLIICDAYYATLHALLNSVHFDRRFNFCPVLRVIGYARVSTQDQHLAIQEDALKQAGCEKLYTDTGSGAHEDRPGLAQAMEVLRAGDTLVVWKLDRLGRSLSHLVRLVNDLQHKGVGFQSLQERIDTTSGIGKLVFHLFAALAEFERDLIRERTKAGLASARARGKRGGRPKALNGKQVALARAMYKDKDNVVKDICAVLGIGKTTLYRYINAGKTDEILHW